MILPKRIMCAGVFSSDLSKLKVVLEDIPGCLRCSSQAPRRHYQGACLLQFLRTSLWNLHCPCFFQVQFLGGPKNGHCQGQRFTPYDICHRTMVLALWLVLQRKEHPVHHPFIPYTCDPPEGPPPQARILCFPSPLPPNGCMRSLLNRFRLPPPLFPFDTSFSIKEGL